MMSPQCARESIVALLLAGLAAGCTSDEWPPFPPAEEPASGAPDDEGEDETFDDARLEVLEPQSASLHEVGEPIALHAVVRELDGPTLPADDVAWVVDDGEHLLDVLEGDVELAAGLYDLRAIARLPNGDRLETEVADVRVQSRWTGIYEGDVELIVEVDISGQSLTPRCVGPLDMGVSLDGRDVRVDDGSCVITVFGQTFDATYTIDVVVYDAGLVRGTIDFAFNSPFGSFDLPIEWAGAFYDERFSGGLEGSVVLPAIGQVGISGSLQALRISPYIDPDEG